VGENGSNYHHAIRRHWKGTAIVDIQVISTSYVTLSLLSTQAINMKGTRL